MNVTAKEVYSQKLLDGTRVATAVRGKVCYLGIRPCKTTTDFMLCNGLEIVFGTNGDGPWRWHKDLDRRVSPEEIIELHNTSEVTVIMETKHHTLKMQIQRSD